MDGIANEQVSQVARQFCHERRIDLDSWVNGVEEEGLRIYDLLTTLDGPVSEDEIRIGLSDSVLNVAKGLQALCYHGVIQHENWTRYQLGSELFCDWFNAERERLIGHLLEPEPEVIVDDSEKPIIHVEGDFIAGDMANVNVAERNNVAVGRESNISVDESVDTPSSLL